MPGKKHPMWETLKGLRGNTRACVLTEPMWGIPFNLYISYASIYMLALGLNDAQIGMIASVGLVFQIIVSFISGAVTDKLGRKRTTLIFDILSWSVPVLIWAAAQNIWFFLAAALFNSLMRITQTSWTCLLTEDAPRDKLVMIWSWIMIACLLSGFFAPLAGVLVGRLTMVTAVRILYIFAFFLMTAKFIILYRFSEETGRGKVRMAETRGVPFLKLISRYNASLKKITGNPYTLTTFFITLTLLVYETVKGIFWSIMVVKGLGLPESSIAAFPFFRSAVMIIFYFLVTPLLNHHEYRLPFAAGFLLMIVSNIFLIISPRGSYLFVGLNTLLDAAALALIGPYKETLVFDAVDPEDRAAILGIFNVALLALASPFGWIAGILSERSRLIPFFLLILLALAGIFLILRAARYRQRFGG